MRIDLIQSPFVVAWTVSRPSTISPNDVYFRFQGGCAVLVMKKRVGWGMKFSTITGSSIKVHATIPGRSNRSSVVNSGRIVQLAVL